MFSFGETPKKASLPVQVKKIDQGLCPCFAESELFTALFKREHVYYATEMYV